jgi:hypothetical protein
MRDVSAQLLDHGTSITREQNGFVLGAAAAMLEEFWDDAPASAGALTDRLRMASPRVGERERDGLDVLPKQFEAAWEAFAEAVDGDVGEAILALLEDPSRLAAALAERDDPRALDLGLISGLVQYGWIFGHSAVVHTDPVEREWALGELDWWVPRVRRALEEWS